MAAQQYLYVMPVSRKQAWEMMEAAVGALNEIALLRVALTDEENLHVPIAMRTIWWKRASKCD